MNARSLSRGLGALGVTATLTVGLAACSWIPDVSMSQNLPQPTKSARPTPSRPTPTSAAPTLSASPAAQAGPVRPSGDLDTGSVTHSLPAGDRNVVINYWTGQEAMKWQAKGDKNIQLSAHVEGGSKLIRVKVTRFLATADDGVHRTTVAEDRGEFAIQPPFSYTTAMTVTPSDPTATSLTVYIQFDMLVETEVDSGEFFRQTVLDTLHLPLLQEVKK